MKKLIILFLVAFSFTANAQVCTPTNVTWERWKNRLDVLYWTSTCPEPNVTFEIMQDFTDDGIPNGTIVTPDGGWRDNGGWPTQQWADANIRWMKQPDKPKEYWVRTLTENGETSVWVEAIK